MISSHYGLKTGIDFDHYGLKLGMVFKGTTKAYELQMNSREMYPKYTVQLKDKRTLHTRMCMLSYAYK